MKLLEICAAHPQGDVRRVGGTDTARHSCLVVLPHAAFNLCFCSWDAHIPSFGDEHIFIFDEKGIHCSEGSVLIEKLRRSNTTESVKELAMNLLGDTCIQKL